tara:strand:+ start:1253 stop:1642 length:390 start_codon:yes stop_codon:yes gene_type:complete
MSNTQPIKFTHNPQTFVNGFISGQRNMFLISSISIGIMGFADSFVNKRYNLFVKTVGVVILLFSIVYGYSITNGFDSYVRFIKNTPDVPSPYSMLRHAWQKWIYLSYVYIAVIASLGAIVFFRKIRHGY